MPALRHALLAIVVGLALAACVSEPGQAIEAEVEVLVAEPGPLSDAAEARLVERGHSAILYLETGLYDAEPRGRAKIVSVLVAIGDPEAAPILAHLAAHDSDPAVRAAAAEGHAALGRRRSRW